jgi:hypothetical protein
MNLSGSVLLEYDGARFEADRAHIVWRAEGQQMIDIEGGAKCHLADGTALQCERVTFDTKTGLGNCSGSVQLKHQQDLATAEQLEFACQEWQLTKAVLREQVHLVQQQQSDPPLYFTADTATMQLPEGRILLESREPYHVMAYGGAQHLRMRATRLRAIYVDGQEPRIEADGSVMLSLTEEQVQSLMAPFQETL